MAGLIQWLWGPLRWAWPACPCDACAARREERAAAGRRFDEATSGPWTTVSVEHDHDRFSNCYEYSTPHEFQQVELDRAARLRDQMRDQLLHDRVVERARDDDRLNDAGEFVLSEEEYRAVLRRNLVDVLPPGHGDVRPTFMGLPIRVVEHDHFPYVPRRT